MPPKRQPQLGGTGEDSKLRVAIVSSDRCKPQKCHQECKKACPVVKTGKLCIEADPSRKVAFISEPLCVGCGICVSRCPFDAISIINLPKDMKRDLTHRFGPNTFKLHRLPVPRHGQVLGLVGTNGIGKSTALRILSGSLRPNLGLHDAPPAWTDILTYFRGSELQNYFKRLTNAEASFTCAMKPQHVTDFDFCRVAGTRGDRPSSPSVAEVLASKVNPERPERVKDIVKEMELSHLMDRGIEKLSGGERQRVAIAVTVISKADVFMFDEPSSYLDIRQRMRAAETIRSTASSSRDAYVIVVEHDLAVLDYMSDFVCCLWGKAGGYGVVSSPLSVGEGINSFMEGFLRTENLRFREEPLKFRIPTDRERDRREGGDPHSYGYPDMRKTLARFTLEVRGGEFSPSEIVVMLGENGCGKTTFIQMLAGRMTPDGEGKEGEKLPKLSVSYKPQTLPRFAGSVREVLMARIPNKFLCPQFNASVIRPLSGEALLDRVFDTLSGGELQRVTVILALGKDADVYLLDEPSAYLDAEQRIEMARVIRRCVLQEKRAAFIVEHDLMMSTYMADRVIVYEGTPGVSCVAHAPEGLVCGMNRFLQSLQITFRKDKNSQRPRVNKKGGVKDREQKAEGKYFLISDSLSSS
uniref:ABC transporter domain-containing protein n=1 Tax=Chromera velia CCMP2878 TaxID=1169474 RepID=A0A0G4I4L1_9ALVE|eukprot:Cvel_10896.t1-p1 / transcript=Cvel_10896.t1 / gene=Cvel_10896 / organism=Chromera_velia_CCMP2878 / gene_product=ABC transporter E family member 2, putative / transcript_product=ABC transporter E family member 2, putative / location=Cvel_scaffold668:71232-73145(+) / protein_length=638 / sequence_SO=supercontig / SO=protein_coding / is_pseudo=false